MIVFSIPFHSLLRVTLYAHARQTNYWEISSEMLKWFHNGYVFIICFLRHYYQERTIFQTNMYKPCSIFVLRFIQIILVSSVLLNIWEGKIYRVRSGLILMTIPLMYGWNYYMMIRYITFENLALRYKGKCKNSVTKKHLQIAWIYKDVKEKCRAGKYIGLVEFIVTL